MKPKTFGQLKLGQSFDFIAPIEPGKLNINSFYLRCVKMSARTYMDEKGTRHAIGSLSAKVYNVLPE